MIDKVGGVILKDKQILVQRKKKRERNRFWNIKKRVTWRIDSRFD